MSARQVLRILELLAPRPEGLRLSEIASVTATYPSSMLRLLRLLREEGYVSQDPVSDRWRATLRLGALGLRQLGSVGAEQWGSDRLSQLADVTNELCVLALSVGDRLVWANHAQGSRAVLIVIPEIGSEVPLHATANGKAFLSTLPDDRVGALLEARGMAAFTPTTITDASVLFSELAQVRRRGYALVVDEMEAGVSAVAAPIRSAEDLSAPAVGGVSVAGPTARLDRRALERFVPALLETADALSLEWPAYRVLVPSPGDPSPTI